MLRQCSELKSSGETVWAIDGGAETITNASVTIPKHNGLRARRRRMTLSFSCDDCPRRIYLRRCKVYRTSFKTGKPVTWRCQVLVQLNHSYSHRGFSPVARKQHSKPET